MHIFEIWQLLYSGFVNDMWFIHWVDLLKSFLISITSFEKRSADLLMAKSDFFWMHQGFDEDIWRKWDIDEFFLNEFVWYKTDDRSFFSGYSLFVICSDKTHSKYMIFILNGPMSCWGWQGICFRNHVCLTW